MPLPLLQIDAFTDRPFAGNPAAVCFLDGPREDKWRQAVAAEMNLSETAFLEKEGDGYRLRWFTPQVEVDLCGHATLASAHALWQTGRVKPGQSVRFQTRSGLLTVEQRGAWIEMDFPALPPQLAEPPPGLLAALRIEPDYVGRTRFDYLLAVPHESSVRDLKPDFRALRAVSARGIIVTAPGHSPYDFVSRFFAPACGIDEDPVTGSAHCSLGPYWHDRLGKSELLAYQASARGGVVGLRMAGARIILRGQARTVVQGELLD